jgi:hypothetical protein
MSMRRFWRELALTVAVVLLHACGDDGADGVKFPDDCVDGRVGCPCSSGERCDAGLTCCDGACVELLTNNDHCGACNRACVVVDADILDAPVGACQEGICTPSILPDDRCTVSGLQCDRACGRIDQVCVEDGCGGYTMFFYPQSDCFGEAPVEGVSIGCDEEVDPPIPNSARCCCTQE